jgi:hypothetical protein
MIGKTATKLTFLGHIMKAILKVMSSVELWTNVRQYHNVQYMTTSFICCGTLRWKSHCLPPSSGNILVWVNGWQGHVAFTKNSIRFSC